MFNKTIIPEPRVLIPTGYLHRAASVTHDVEWVVILTTDLKNMADCV
jgi:hypothetical protein